MIELFNFLSGGVPGGLLLALMLLISGNIFFRLLKSSKIINPNQSKKSQINFSVILIFVYVTLWFALRPPLPPQRIIVLPTQSNTEKFELNAKSFFIAEMIQRHAIGNLQEKYIFHRWEWLLETLGTDSATEYNNWFDAAKNMGAQVIVDSKFNENNIIFNVIELDDEVESGQEFFIENINELPGFINHFDQSYSVFKSSSFLSKSIEDEYITAKIKYHLKDYDGAFQIIENREDFESQILKAAIHLQKGLSIKIDRIKAQYVKVENKEFDQVRKILVPILKERQDLPKAAYIMGRIALREGEYQKADTYLKKAFIDDPSNCRIHLALSYLLNERLEEIGYNNRIEILERTAFIDPGYANAVYELAKEYYETGTGTPTGSGTTYALQTMEKFLKIKADDPKILSLLASVYLKISRIDDAQIIFEKLFDMFPNDSNAHYNLGILNYQKKNYQKALEYFLKAIEIDENLDAYLYVGVIYRDLGEKDKALEYFRERVKRMTGEDDIFAKEAMQGIRNILENIETDTTNEN